MKSNWCYLYRGINEDGNLVDVRLSHKQDTEVAKAVFAQAHEIAKYVPEQVITDGYTSYPRAVSEVLGEGIKHDVRSFMGID